MESLLFKNYHNSKVTEQVYKTVSVIFYYGNIKVIAVNCHYLLGMHEKTHNM